MDIKEFISKQREFDANFPSFSEWAKPINKDNLHVLGFLLISLQGEIGECCNIYKKVIRKDMDFLNVKHDITEEIVDAFIYLIKIIDQMDIDIDKEYLAKQEKNVLRFKRMGK